jgi:hypothetical protein
VFSLDNEPAPGLQRTDRASDAERLAELEREIRDLRQTVRELRGALDPLVLARGELDAALASAQEIRVAGRARAESVRAESLSRAQRIAARSDHRSQEILRRGILDAERIEARSDAQAEAIAGEAQRRLQALGVSAELSNSEPPAAPSDWKGRAPVEVAPGPEAQIVSPSSDPLQPRGHRSRTRDDAGSAPKPGPAGPAEEGDASTLWLSVSTIAGKDLRCRLRGTLSFPGLLVLERAVRALAGVESVWVGPDPQGFGLAIVSENPGQTLQDLLNLSEFSIRMREE